MNLIAAVDTNWGIGYKGNLLFRNPIDMKFFRDKTIGNVVVMGMKTLESFKDKKPLPNRTNLVLTRQDISIDGCIVSHSIDEALSILSEYHVGSVFIIGGGQIYEQFLPYCNTAYITKIDKPFIADTFFPNLDNDKEWFISDSSDYYTYDDTKFRFVTYTRSLNLDFL